MFVVVKMGLMLWVGERVRVSVGILCTNEEREGSCREWVADAMAVVGRLEWGWGWGW